MYTLDNAASQRTAEVAGLVRRPELEELDNGIHAVILVSHWINEHDWRIGSGAVTKRRTATSLGYGALSTRSP
jgi:hypothetical protein